MSTLRVLQIEDSESDAAMIIRLLEKSGKLIQSDRVEDEEQMKEALARQPWDAVICDYRLPQFDAPQALAVLRERRPRHPVYCRFRHHWRRHRGGDDAGRRRGLHDEEQPRPALPQPSSGGCGGAKTGGIAKKAEQALQESEERCRRAVVDSPIPIILHAEDGDGYPNQPVLV